ncbi:uncharacterized protein LOC129577686 isoform X3 [Sitodiplosis mosellana]|uniref:uncharacterized protein LOC129577686 isoform X3 n=1 Tax=Sitodiplosis mosellana TaxID=263140 RepID=UPI002444D545|nr:uncharacterized protein LOC129577686 isoform X3 [Sitodiplosis mosellana]
MSTRLRSSSVGSKPKPRLHHPSRAESAQAVALDVRCACQFYETKSLLPERVNPVGYNTAEEFGPCVHIQAKMKNLGEPAAQSGSETGFPIVSSTSVQSPTMAQPFSPSQPQSNVYDLPPEFAPENLITDSNTAISPSDRSASCNNMGGVAPQLMKQRDPSTSSLLRKRMSEEQQGFSTLNKRMSQSTVSRDRFITQKDPSQSTILRRKMYNRSSASFDRASSEMVSNERFQPFHFQQSRIPNERTFYHDSNEFLRDSNMEIESPKTESSPPRDIAPPKVEPLSMQSQGNRRYVLGSTENLPQRPDLYAKTSVETEPDSGIDSNFIEDTPRKTDTEKQLMQHNRRLHGQNVCDEEKVLLLSKTQNLNVPDGDEGTTPKPKPKPRPTRRGLQLMKVEDVQTVEMPTQSKVQIQYMAKFDSTLRPQEAETNEYSYSKIFDNYKSSQTTLAPAVPDSRMSTPDLRNQGPGYIRQRDPSQSPFLQNRYRAMPTSTPVPTPKPTPRQRKAVKQMPMSMDMELKTSHEKLLPPAGEYPERRASEVSPPHLDQQMNQQFIRQKDMRTSNILNRRRRNLSQTSLGRESVMIDQPLKITKTISFEKDFAQSDSDHISPYTGTPVIISNGVSFEFGKSLPIDQIVRLDFSNSSASRRPFRDHEYEPIGEPVATTKPEQSFERPVVKITEPESPITEPPQSDIIVHEERISFDGTESPIRSITPYTDNSRTEDVHTSQIDDSVIEELPLRREDRKKKSFMTNAGETTKNLQSKISSKASNLRTKFKRSLKSSGGSGGGAGSSQKSSGSNLKSSLKSSPKTSQTSPKERKKFKRIDFTNKFKSIHMPKVSRPELPKFKMPDKFKMSRSEAQATDAPVTTTTVTTEASVDEPSALGTADGTPTVVSVVTTEEIIETKVVPKKRFEFGSYPKIFNRFKSQQPTKSDELPHDVTDFVSEDTERDTATQASSSSFSTHFATVPRTASKIKNSLISKWNKTSFSRSADREDSESIPQSGSLPRHHNDVHEDSVERRIRLASKMSMEDEEEPLGILQTKEQIQLASYDEENRAIHEISRAREHEFKARKPLTHQDSDIISDESIRDIDWEECERMRNKIMGAQRTFEYEDDVPKRDSRGRRLRNDSNFSTEETQSSGSSGDRRRTGVIEDIDDDEFFLRQRGVSQDNAEISKYISSAIREGHASYPYDENNADFPDEEYQDFTERPRKPLRRRAGGFNRSYESYDDYHDNVSDHEIPVATQYFPRHDDENILFYDNDFVDDMDHPNILSREEHFDSDIDNEEHPAVKPKVPKRRHKGRAPTKQDSIEANEEVLVYRSEPSFTVPIDEPSDTHFIVKPVRKNRSISSKSDLAPDNQEPLDREPETIEKYSPSNSRYTIDIKETNGYATVKKDPPARPPAPARRHKRSTKSHGGDSLQPDTSRSIFKDSPFPERQKRSFNAPSRPPRRGSSSSLVDQHKPPSIAPSDGTQYEEIDDDLNDDEENEFYPHKMHNRPLPPPPRPPRDKRRRNKSNIDKKFDDNDDDAEQIVAGSFDDSEFSTREFVGAEMATQTSMDIDDLYLNDDVPIEDISTEQCTRTVEEILRSSDEQPTQKTFRTSNDNLAKGIQKFRESNQRSYSERSRASTERQSSRPITPSALVIEQRITRSPVEMDATLIMQPVDDPPKVDYRTDSAESEYVPYADDVDDTHLDTEDERIINAAIRRYQMLGNELDEHSATPRGTTPKATEDENNLDVRTKSTIEAPQPPPRRKSSANATQITDTINVPLAEPETLSVASTQDLNRYTPEPVNDLSSENVEPTHAQVDSLTVVNIQSTESETNEKPETKPIVSNLQITPEVMQVIIERVRETLPVQPPVSAQPALESVESEPKLQEEIMKKVITETETEAKEKASEEPKESEEPPKRPPTPTDYTPTSEIPASFYRLRTGISDDESSLPPSAVPKHRPRKHARRPESSSDEECNRRHHHHPHHSQQSSRSQDLSIADLSGQLIRACGRALSSSLNTAGHSLVDFLRSLTKNQDDQQKDLSLVLVILIIIVASLMMLGISGDRSVHHHHWDYFNPPDNLGRR